MSGDEKMFWVIALWTSSLLFAVALFLSIGNGFEPDVMAGFTDGSGVLITGGTLAIFTQWWLLRVVYLKGKSHR